MARRQRHLTYEEEGELVKEFEAQSDRGVAIVIAAYVDAKLHEVLEYFFSDNLSPKQKELVFRAPNVPLHGFSARIRIARALGLIGPKTEHDLHIIRELRNDFAHHLLIQDFSNEDVINKCRALHLADVSLFGGTPPIEPRKRLIQAAVLALHHLYGELRARKSCAIPPTVSP